VTEGGRAARASRPLVLDGHDGSGKTTLAIRLADELGARYLRPFAPPAGERLLELAAERRYDEALELGRRAVARAAATEPGRPQIFDRHWMTVLSLLPEEHWDRFDPMPPTLLCWSDLDTTLARLAERDGASPNAAAVREHEFYLERYKLIADRFGQQVLRTDRLTADEAFERAREWALAAA
jgi:DNA polymerase III delta prime subunit